MRERESEREGEGWGGGGNRLIKEGAQTDFPWVGVYILLLEEFSNFLADALHACKYTTVSKETYQGANETYSTAYLAHVFGTCRRQLPRAVEHELKLEQCLYIYTYIHTHTHTHTRTHTYRPH